VARPAGAAAHFAAAQQQRHCFHNGTAHPWCARPRSIKVVVVVLTWPRHCGAQASRTISKAITSLIDASSVDAALNMLCRHLSNLVDRARTDGCSEQLTVTIAQSRSRHKEQT